MKTIIKKVRAEAKVSDSVYYEIVEHNGRKFKIYIEFSNGDILGFNSKCCVSVMSADGVFGRVVDNRELGISCMNDLYCSDNLARKNAEFDRIVSEFKDYITTVY